MSTFLRQNPGFSFSSLKGFATCLSVLLIFTFEPSEKMPFYTILCLGDSYTIGESVLPAENFPNQTVQLLRKSNYDFEDAAVVAKTGWTTDELQQAIKAHSFKSRYNFVTLLIGVNNQYRGRSVENYKPEFESLLKQAIELANKKPEHVIVLSIPDWGVTPFAKNSNRNIQQIAKEIDEYNEANEKISKKYRVQYINITPGTREALNDISLIAADGLHPSSKEYARWAEKISFLIKSQLN
jgi:lysophospholipase L1-like esterase